MTEGEMVALFLEVGYNHDRPAGTCLALAQYIKNRGFVKMIEGVELKQPSKRRLEYWPDEIFQLLVLSPEKHKNVEYYRAQSIEVKSGAGDLPDTPTSFAQGLIQVRHCTAVQQDDLTRLGLSLLEHGFVTAEDAARADREEHQRRPLQVDQ